MRDMTGKVIISIDGFDALASKKQDDLTHLIQHRAYDKAIRDLIEKVQNIKNDEKYDADPSVSTKGALIRYHNTLFINGPRGSGKTYFLLNIETYLNESYKTHRYANDFKEAGHFHPTDLLFLHPVDPTLMESEENFLSVIIAELLNHYQRKRQSEKLPDDLRQKVMAITAAMDGLQIKADEARAVEVIAGNQTGIMLALKVHDFLKAYTQVLNTKAIALLIDDIDLAFEKGFEVLEVLRKYLASQYVIPVITGDIDLYRYIIHEHFCKVGHYDRCSGSQIDHEVENLPAAYLEKIFKHHSRIDLLPLAEIENERKILIQTREHKRNRPNEGEEAGDPFGQHIFHAFGRILHIDAVWKKETFFYQVIEHIGKNLKRHRGVRSVIQFLVWLEHYSHEDFVKDVRIINDKEPEYCAVKLLLWIEIFVHKKFELRLLEDKDYFDFEKSSKAKKASDDEPPGSLFECAKDLPAKQRLKSRLMDRCIAAIIDPEQRKLARQFSCEGRLKELSGLTPDEVIQKATDALDNKLCDDRDHIAMLLVHRAKAHTSQKNYGTALFDFTVAIRHASDTNAVVYVALGEFYEQQSEYDKAADAYREGFRRNSTDFKQVLNAAAMYAKAGLHKTAIDVLETALKRPIGRDNEIQALGLLTQAYNQIDDTDNAEKAYKRLLAMAPDDVEVLEELGNLYLGTEEYVKAAEIFEQLVDSFPDEEEFLELLGFALTESMQYEKALGFLLKAEQKEHSAEYWFYLGYAYMGLKRYAEAAQAFEQALSQEHDEIIWFGLCLANLQAQNLTMAMKHLGKAREIHPKHEDLFILFAMAALHSGSFETAITEADQRYFADNLRAMAHLEMFRIFHLSRERSGIKSKLKAWHIHYSGIKISDIVIESMRLWIAQSISSDKMRTDLYNLLSSFEIHAA